MRLFASLGLAVVLAGCGGGHGATAPPVVPGVPAPTGDPGKSAAAAVQIRVSIPAPSKSTGSRRPRYISSATNSLTFTPDGGTVQTVPLTPTSPGCSPGAGGARSCTFNGSAPVGTNVGFTVATFASANGSGVPLSIVHGTHTVVAGQTNPLALTLNAVVGSISVSLAPNAFTAGKASTSSVTVTVLDPANQTIVVPPGTYSDANGNPVTIGLTDSDASGHTHLSAATVGSGPITLSYDGGTPVAPSVTVTATGGGQTGAATLAIQPSRSSLYLLNGGDSTVAEFVLPLAGGQAPRRAFAGASVAACAPSYATVGGKPIYYPGVASLALDGGGNTFVESGSGQPCTSTVYEYAASAIPKTVPTTSFVTDVTMQGDAQTLGVDPTSGYLDVNDAVQSPIAGFYALQFDPSSPAKPANTFSVGCVLPGQPACQGTNTNGIIHAAFDPSGDFVFAVVDPQSGNLLFAVVPPTSAFQATAWIEGTGTAGVFGGGDQIAGMAVDEQDMLYVLFDGQGLTGYSQCVPTSALAGTVACTDGQTHQYLVAFDLKQLAGKTGAVDMQPTFVLGGDGTSRFGPCYLSIGNCGDVFYNPGATMIAASQGYVAVASPIGPDCSASCQGTVFSATSPGSAPAGEVDLYHVAGVTGTHVGDGTSQPVAVLNGTFVRLPAGVAFGPTGTGIGTSGLRRSTAVRATRVPRDLRQSSGSRGKH